MTRNPTGLILAGIAGLLTVGCDKAEKTYPEKAPLPVSVMTLSESTPVAARKVAGSVRSWKTEDIGFEVSGRVQWVVEPGLQIEGRRFDTDGNLVSPGTQLAQIDPERFETALETAKAQVKIAELQKETVSVQIKNGLPAELSAAEAELQLAKTQYDRDLRLLNQNAGSQTEVDQAQAALKSAEAKIKGIKAKQEQSNAELSSGSAAINQAKQSLKEAERNLADTKLFSSFRGQVANVHVVPGSVVAQGEAVATVQMMNPIKVEVQVSANLSRSLRQNDTMPIVVTTADDQQRTLGGVIYSIAASADSATRTFTLTLLAPNPKVELSLPKELEGKRIARAGGLWKIDFPLLNKVPEGTFYMPETGIFQDGEGSYVWRVTNFRVGEQSQRLLRVKKLRITPGETSVPFLGKELFRTLTVNAGQNFDPSNELVAADVMVSDADNGPWEGDAMLLDDGGRWLMRPGDVVEVDLASQANERGLYVPIEAIHHDIDQTFLYVIQTKDSKTIARQLAIELVSEGDTKAGSLQQVKPKSADDKLVGAQIVVGGVHYLIDGQEVRVSEKSGAAE